MSDDAPDHVSTDTPAELTAAQVRHVAKLARLDPSDAEVETDRVRLAAVLGYIDRMRALDLEGVEPLMHVGEHTNRLADDEPGDSLSPETVRQLAPSTFIDTQQADNDSSDPDSGEPIEHIYIKVPKVLGEGGGA